MKMPTFSCCKRCIIVLFVIGISVVLIHGWLTYKSYLFTEKAVSSIAKKHVAAKGSNVTFDVKEAFHNVHRDLSAKYPGHILPATDLQWVFINAGGWMGAACVVHASLTEYVLFFGTALDTSGHSGRYWANISDTLLVGEFRQWKEGELTARIHKPGAFVRHEWGSVAGSHFKAGTWAVEYGRGFIPSTLGFAFADTVFSTLDFVTLFNTMHVYLKALLLEAGYYMTHVQELWA